MIRGGGFGQAEAFGEDSPGPTLAGTAGAVGGVGGALGGAGGNQVQRRLQSVAVMSLNALGGFHSAMAATWSPHG